MAPPKNVRPTPVVQAPQVATLSHPRRPPAHRSVSLLHHVRPKASPLQERSDSSSDDQRGPQPDHMAAKLNDSPSSLLPLGRDSSGESSNADRWFEQSNNQVRKGGATFTDNDPPFFLRNSSSSGTPPEGLKAGRPKPTPIDGSSSLPLRTGLLHLGTDGSSTEDFRSVIDDLTIENKKLKRKLKKYEKLHDSHLRDEKLFEVRIHGLPPEKKRELEETLRKFTSGLGATGFHPNGYEGLMPVLNTNRTESSATSLQNPDSAYASMSASGQGSSAQSGNDNKTRSRFPGAMRQQNVDMYLRHIPEGILLQQHPTTMTERAKRKLVVRRLEQIFAGKGAVAGPHQHPMQQQEISYAAREAKLGENTSQPHLFEGSREALIMKGDRQEHADSIKHGESHASPHENEGSQDKHNQTNQPTTTNQNHGHVDNDQRPTRPLDLDIHRAQVPAENMRYIRHLGFSPLDSSAERAQDDRHGWIYLNLLINMAQLHTINVTGDFVRKAISDYSKKLELSHDGRKVRWKGGSSVTRTSSSGGGSSGDRFSMDTPDGLSPRKRPRLMGRDSGRGTNGATSSRMQDNKLVYTPLFFHKDSTEDDDGSSEDEEDESWESPFPAAVAGDSSGMTSSGVRTTSTKNKRHDDGPIIFYNNARFCTDLSGDRRPLPNEKVPPYNKMSAIPLGKAQSPSSGLISEKRGPLAHATELPEPMDLSDNPIPASMELSFPPASQMGSSTQPTPLPMNMEVSGIGGVWPSDHFSIAMESRFAITDSFERSKDERSLATSKPLPPRFAALLRPEGEQPKSDVPPRHSEIINMKHEKLPPSSLPPALTFMPFGGDSTGDDESDVDDQMSISPGSPGSVPPSAAPQPVGLHYMSSEDDDHEVEEDDDENDGNDDDDGSLDLLATAREADPEAIRAREREYDANMAERLAEDIPAGSSAATAGGGSGFASPIAGMNQEEYQRAVKEARARPEILKRARTSGSMKVQTAEGSSLESDDDDEEDEAMGDVAS